MNANVATQPNLGTVETVIPAAELDRLARQAAANSYRYDLDAPGFIELEVVLEIVPIGRSKWYEGQKSGVYPKPVPLGIGRRRAYRRSDIKALVQRLEIGQG